MGENKKEKNIDAEIETIRKELNSINHGSLHITVQDGMIVLIEKNEKYKVR